jgi:serine/threonine protein kinase/tetratricopeptide (TPR) repeat protein
MLGETISHYKILSKLGEGGMGVVYKAHDEKLHRHVALKFLPREMSADPDVQKRFIQEARASSALDHPNISTVYEINETDEGGLFIVMPCYEGESLHERLARGPLEVNEALRIAAEVARGLARAHDSGVIHRDIKPGNIMLVSDGPAKIMDFGLAMISGASRLTQDGTMLGTAAYMSPEQAQGGGIDNRTDVWSLGAVLYEMLSGKAPFEADHQLAVMYSIMNEEPEPLSSVDTGIPFEVEQLVSKAMEKDAGKRFQTAREMADSLDELREQLDLLPKRTELGKRMIRQRRKIVIRGLFSIAAAALVVFMAWYLWFGRAEAMYPIAVLPFETATEGSEEEILSESITGELTSELSYIGSIGVISNRTARLYGESDKPTSEIAGELDVRAVVHGLVKEVGDRLNLSVQLIQATPEQILWSEEFDCSRGELPDLYRTITRNIAGTIGAQITEREETRLVASKKTADEAYKAYMFGQHYSGLLLESNDSLLLDKVLFYSGRAIEIDSAFAPAHALRANAIAYYFRWRTSSRMDSLMTVARADAELAVELDPDLPDAYIALAQLLVHDIDLEGMKRAYEKAVELDRSPGTLSAYSGNGLTWVGEFTEAVAIAREAVRLDPVAEYTHHNLAWVLCIARQFDEALEKELENIEMFPGTDDFLVVWIYIEQKKFEEAAKIIRERGDDPGFSDEESWRLSMIKGIETDSLICINVGYNLRAYEISRAYADLEYTELAMQWLEEAGRAVPRDLTQINSDPQFDVLRPAPRFQALMKKFNIPSGELAALE